MEVIVFPDIPPISLGASYAYCGVAASRVVSALPAIQPGFMACGILEARSASGVAHFNRNRSTALATRGRFRPAEPGIGREARMTVRTGLRTTLLVAAAAVAASFVGGAVPDCASAQGAGCAEGCRASYGDCYRATANRQACEAQLQRCLQGCIASKRN
jgi:hypothetical protein